MLATLSPRASSQQKRLKFPEQESLARINQLKHSCDLLNAGFEKLDCLVEDYIHAVPLGARDTDRHDADRFLKWISSATLTAEQQDLITCLRSHYAVEFISFKRRLAFQRFMEMSRKSQTQLAKAVLPSRGVLQLNPLHVWATFETHVLLDEETIVPATVLFYPNAQGIQTTVLGDEAQAIIKKLEAGHTSVKRILKGLSGNQQEKKLRLIKDLIISGVIAFQS